jgi:hypothetical protein
VRDTQLQIPEVVEEWSIVDRWWTGEPDRHEYKVVQWGANRLLFRRDEGDPVWHLLGVDT